MWGARREGDRAHLHAAAIFRLCVLGGGPGYWNLTRVPVPEKVLCRKHRNIWQMFPVTVGSGALIIYLEAVREELGAEPLRQWDGTVW